MFRYLNSMLNTSALRTLMLVIVLLAFVAFLTTGCAEPEDPLDEPMDDPGGAPGNGAPGGNGF